MTAAVLAAGFALGAGLGAAHFLSLWWCVARIGEGRTALGLAGQGLRFALLAAALVVVARQGASLFLAAAAGVIAVRFLLTRHYRRLA